MRPPDSIDRGAGTERVVLSVCACPQLGIGGC